MKDVDKSISKDKIDGRASLRTRRRLVSTRLDPQILTLSSGFNSLGRPRFELQ